MRGARARARYAVVGVLGALAAGTALVAPPSTGALAGVPFGAGARITSAGAVTPASPHRSPRAASSPEPYFPVAPRRLVDTRCSAVPRPSFCAGENLPAANAGLATLSASGGSSWSSPDPVYPDRELNSMSCSSTSFCMALNYNNTVLTWNGSSWSGALSVADANGMGLDAVACTSASFCVTGDNKGNILTWNGTSWSKPQPVDPNGNGFASLSCPGPGDCVAIDLNGRVLTWNGSSWSSPKLVDNVGLVNSISCPTASFCMASDAAGHVVTFSGSSWSSPQLVDGHAGTFFVSCASASFCGAVDDYGRALTWNGKTWTAPQSIDPSTGFDSISCPSSSFCVAGDGLGDVSTWSGSSWSSPHAIDAGSGGIVSVSCPSPAFCAAGTFSGDALVLHSSPKHLTIDAQVGGVGGVPSSALDAVLDVTAVHPTAPGYLTVYPAGSSRPAASDLNFPSGATVANLVEVALSSSGQIAITDGSAAGTVDVLVDLEGYVAPPGAGASGDAFAPIAPERIADTRCFSSSFSGANSAYCTSLLDSVSPAGQVPAKGSVTIDVPAALASAGALVANLTVADTTAPGYLTVYPAGKSRPIVSNLNFGAGQVVANRIEVPLTSGALSVYDGSASPVDIIVDVNGTYSAGTGSLYSGVSPARIVDTRCGAQPPLPSALRRTSRRAMRRCRLSVLEPPPPSR